MKAFLVVKNKSPWDSLGKKGEFNGRWGFGVDLRNTPQGRDAAGPEALTEPWDWRTAWNPGGSHPPPQPCFSLRTHMVEDRSYHQPLSSKEQLDRNFSVMIPADCLSSDRDPPVDTAVSLDKRMLGRHGCCHAGWLGREESPENPPWVVKSDGAVRPARETRCRNRT